VSDELLILITAAASIGFFHTLLGPDHYLPFVAMSRSGKWSLSKTTLVTILCGIGHVLSSVLLGVLGITLGIAVSKLEAIESSRGTIAAWALIAFGLVYFVWGMRKALRNKPHKHLHMHVHKEGGIKNITPWVLFIIFVLGPCEPLIPLLMYPAAKSSLFGLVLVTTIFGSVTIMTMLGVVIISSFGINFVSIKRLERYTHAFAGATICLSGMAIQFLGL
jgi:sulfite exporter TauE/SafE